MHFFSPHPLLRSFAPAALVWQINTPHKKIYLTFDDGPTPGVTDEIIRMLNDFNAKATFFCLGEKVEKNVKLYLKVLQNGHAVGNHTYSHMNAWKCTKKEFINDIFRSLELFPSALFRPPYGNIPFWGLQAIHQKFIVVMWSLMSYDFDPNLSVDKILKVIANKNTNGSIWTFHDTHQAKALCLKALPLLLDKYSKEGFIFENLEVALEERIRIKKMAASARGNGIEDKREIGEIFRGYRNSQCDI